MTAASIQENTKTAASAAQEGSDDDQQPAEHTALTIPEPANPYTKTLSLHLHHWQIFYVLAFFTRFSHPVSQVGAGIVLACYMEGICACKLSRT
ncbi:hypothetical protein BX666DRAFT_1974773 [Dichotomocladium elegans]|nr:hypothetical protein BX666DRAFT_1974773 [Dichotomocladium elegans]